MKQSETLRASINYSAIQMKQSGNGLLCADIALLQLIKEESSHAYHILTRLLKDWEVYQVKIRLERDIYEAQNMKCKAERVDCNESVEALGRRISETAVEMKCGMPDVVNTGHLLLVIIADNSMMSSRILRLYGITREQIENQLYELPADENYYDDINALRQFEDIHNENLAKDDSDLASDDSYGINSSLAAKNQSALERFAVNLSHQAKMGEIDCVIGRDQEIERLIQVLGRRKKNNPILVGEAGVGKSAIVEGLALKIYKGDVPTALQDKVLYSLDIASLIAGTKYRGEFESRIKSLIDELTENRDAILFIDEIHTIVGAGSTQGNLDVANILKPALARGVVQCVGATTLDEYRECIESDSALERRFQRIIVEPASPKQTLEILHIIRSYYEHHHNVRYTDAALKCCVDLTARYITDRHFPDKAIDVLDEAGSKSHLQNAIEPQSIRDLEASLREVELRAKEAVSKLSYNEAVEARTEIATLKEQLNNSRSTWRREQTLNPPMVDVEQIEEIITSITGIPVDRVSQSEKERLMKLGEYLEGIVIGQKEAVHRVAKSIRRSRAGLKEDCKPIGVFMFVGPTGVGKTLLAKELSKWLFDKEESLIRVDMSEYSEKHSISRLIGSPPGYVGHGEGGQLTESVRRQPYAVVLFDEIEKAHPDMFNLMLQILDEGHLTDGMGRKVDFRNTIIIMTSNVGSQAVAKRGNLVGYDTKGYQDSEVLNRESIYRRSLENTFAPEFINRVDDIIIFNTLTVEDIYSIVELEISKLVSRALTLGVTVDFSPEAKAKLVNEGYQPRYGVRSLKRAILDLIEEPLADMIVCGELSGGDKVSVQDIRGETELMRYAI